MITARPFRFSLIAAFALGCGAPSTPTGADATAAAAAPPAAPAVPALIRIDGSSTVHPIQEAVAEEFQKTNPARVTIAVSGTGGGFKKLCAGEIDIAGASRPVKATEVDACAKAGIEMIELPVAYDGLAVVVHPSNPLTSVTVAELKAMWEPAAQGKVLRWNQVRAGLPDQELHLFGAGVDSGTYDYFTQAIVGKEHESRGDYTSSEDDMVLVQGVASDPNALGFFGYGYVAQNADKVRAVPVDDGVATNGDGPIAPSPSTVADGTYQPLSRPLFIYVARAAADRPDVQAFIAAYLTTGGKLAAEVGFVALPDAAYALAKARFDARKTGSMFGDGSKVGVTIEALMQAEGS